MKTIDSLVPDIYKVIEGNGGWDETITEFLSKEISTVVEDRLSKEQQPRTELSPSSLGTQCYRQMWYKFNLPYDNTTSAQMLGTFLYGDILERFVVSLVKAAGHDIYIFKEPLSFLGLKGTPDAIIDGVLVDIKSASGFGFKKFKEHRLKEEDPYGYISQLSSYLYALKDDNRIHSKTRAAFLVINKERFEIVLDLYDFSSELKQKVNEVKTAKSIIKQKSPPARPLWTFSKKVTDDEGEKVEQTYLQEDEDFGESGNRKLGRTCSYCPFKFKCWDGLRVFKYANGLVYFTHVEKEPKVEEVTENFYWVVEEN